MEAPMLASAMCWALCWASDYTAWPLPLSPGGGAREQPVCRGESGPHRGCPGRHSHLALPTPKPEPGTTMEHNRALGHQELHWKEFRFDLTQIPAGEEVTAAEFRIYKLPSTHLLNRTLHISMFEVVREQSNRESDLFFLDLQTLRAEDEGWLVLDVTAASDHWSLNPNKDLGLRLYVETEDGRSVDPGLAGLLGRQAPRSKQPFMGGPQPRVSPSGSEAPEEATEENQRAAAPAQTPWDLRCAHQGGPCPGSSPRELHRAGAPEKTLHVPPADDVHGSDGRHVCHRHKLYDWVIAPQGYSAYYCDGECSFPLDSCMNATNHAILQSLVHLMKPDAVPKACCAPTKLSATSVLYYDSSNNVILCKHRNMVVRACGCH
ncbi:hypothetical protein MC885_019920 [Smutsia gigantea]|nr:hypothetical protein MC885_019920 [Smutsia gigantea]